MQDGTSCRLDLLIAMTSADVIVLAKLVHTLRPRQVLVFTTSYAQSRGWQDSTNRMLEAAQRGGIIQNFRLAPLVDSTLADQLTHFRRTLQETFRNAPATASRIAFDCTTGRGIFRVLGYEACRQLVRELGWSMSVAFCDADARQVVTVSTDSDRFVIDSKPIAFRFSNRRESVVERFAMYGVEVTEFTRVWPPAEAKRSEQAPPPDVCFRLYRELCEKPRLRALFHSFWKHLGEWQRRQVFNDQGTTRRPAEFRQFLRAQVRAAADRVTQAVPLKQRRRKRLHSHIIEHIDRALEDFVGDVVSLDRWIRRYLKDRSMRRLNIILQQAVSPRICDHIPRWARRPETTACVSAAMRELVSELRRELNYIVVATGGDPGAGNVRSDEVRAFVESFLDFELPSDVRRSLLESKKTADLFEHAIAYGVVEAIDQDQRLRQAVASVYRNVTVRRGPESLCELDTLVLFRSGDLLAFEAKTHYSNADRKKIESNIKQLRDFGGAYSRYVLVYPLTEAELRTLSKLVKAETGTIDRLDMGGDAVGWAEHIRDLERSRDRRVVGLDRLGQTLRDAAGLA